MSDGGQGRGPDNPLATVPHDAVGGDANVAPVQGFSPAGQLLTMMTGYWVSQAIHTAAELGIADLLGRRGQSVADLAAATGTQPDSLYRLLRALASVGVFQETAPREFGLAPMGVLLRDDTPGNLRAFARLQGDSWHWDCWGDLTATVRTGRSAIESRYGAADCFEYLVGESRSRTIFDAAMRGYSAQVHAAILDVQDFSQLPNTGANEPPNGSSAPVIIDVGGGSGGLLAAILGATPRAHGTLLDRDDTAAQARAWFQTLELSPRAQALAGNFFDKVPDGGDWYLLSAILHDWNDAQCVEILRVVAAAMHPLARLLIIENLIPAGNQAHAAKFIDLEMMLIAQGRERTEAEYAALLAQAGLRIGQVRETAMPVSIIQAQK